MIQVRCEGCGQKLNASPKLAGKAVKCPKCRATIKVPTGTTTAKPRPVVQAKPVASVPVAVPVAQPTTPQVNVPTPTTTPQVVVASSPSTNSGDGFSVNTGETKGKSAVKPKHRKKSLAGLFLVLGSVAALAIAGVVAVVVLLSDTTPDLALGAIESQRFTEHQEISVTIAPKDSYWRGKLVTYKLKEAPDGATINADTGQIRWTPSEQQGGAAYEFEVTATTLVEEPHLRKKVEASTKFSIDVTEFNSRPKFEAVEEQTITLGEPWSLQLVASDPDEPQQELRYELANDVAKGAEVDAETGLVQWTPDETFANKRVPIRVKAVEAGAGGQSTLTQLIVTVTRPRPTTASAPPTTIVKNDSPSMTTTEAPDPTPPLSDAPKPKPPPLTPPVATVPGGEEFDAVAGLLADKSLFKEKSYFLVRKYFAAQAEVEHRPTLQSTLGDQAADLESWLAEHTDIKEELYTAIDSQHDDVAEVFHIFNAIRKAHPTKIEEYGSLAIACSLVWDKPNRSVYDYTGHSRRCKSTLPSDRPEAGENFEYFLNTEQLMQGRAQLLPWEFLIHVVNHRTPVNERKWALGSYLQKRAMFGKCYHDVPYDTEMLESKSEVANMNDKDYTLPNLKQHGGVCAMQADYAARVGKSLGVPAEYVSGASRFGARHAWVMWVELHAVSAKSISFSLESHGRYRGDKYYVGDLRDPHTGQAITDRQLELRLNVVGTDALKKRHADLLMAALPILETRESLEIDMRLDYLNGVLQLSPGNEQAWHSVADMSSNPEVQAERQKQMAKVLDKFFLTFARFPDFTWEVFEKLVAYETITKKRLALYDRLSQLYVKAERPDLACEARLRLADLLIEDERPEDAIPGLAVTIQAFPDEGRYVPRILDKLETTCEQVGGAEQQLLAFYNSFIPKITKFRGNRPSEYCIEMYERAIEKFKAYDQPQIAQLYQAQLEQIRAGKK